MSCFCLSLLTPGGSILGGAVVFLAGFGSDAFKECFVSKVFCPVFVGGFRAVAGFSSMNSSSHKEWLSSMVSNLLNKAKLVTFF